MLLDLEAIKSISRKVETNIAQGRYKQAAYLSRQLSPVRIASILAQSRNEASAGCLKEMDKKKAALVLASMPSEVAAGVIMAIPETERIKLLNKVPVDNISDLLQSIGQEERVNLVNFLETRLQKHMSKIKRYPNGSAGRIMTPFFLTVNGAQTVSETLESIMSAPSEVEKSPYIYVLNSEGRPAGVVSVKDLLRVEPAKKINELMKPDLVVVGVLDSAQEAAFTIRNRRLTMLPVLDEGGFICGVITFDDAMKVLSEDAVNLFTSAAGTYEESFFTPPLKSVRSRLPWMAANVFLNMAAVAVIAGFETTIATVAILAAFIPMITDMGGNVGIQSLSVAIRSIALGEARLRDFRKVIKKETVIGLLQGASLGFLFAFIAFLLRGNLFLGLVAGLALGVNVLIAGIVGGMLPFLIKALGKDPAMMTGPFLTTITDITGVSVYLGLSTALIHYL